MLQGSDLTPLYALAGAVIVGLMSGGFAWLKDKSAAKTVVEAELRRYAREDEMAKRVEEANERNALKVIAASKIVGEVVVASSEKTDSQIERVHILVNSEKTAEFKNQLTTNELLSMLLQDKVNQPDPDPKHVALLEQVTARINELHAILADRDKQQAFAEAQLAQAKLESEAKITAASSVSAAVDAAVAKALADK